MEVDGGVSHTQVQRNVVIQHINQPVAIHHASHPGMQARNIISAGHVSGLENIILVDVHLGKPLCASCAFTTESAPPIFTGRVHSQRWYMLFSP